MPVLVNFQIFLNSTTSIKDDRLLEFLLPLHEQAHGCFECSNMWGKELHVMDVTIYNLILHLKVGYIIDGLHSSLLPAGGSSTSAGPTLTIH